MSLRVRPFHAADMAAIEARHNHVGALEPEHRAALFAAYEQAGGSFTLWEHREDADPRVLFCGGAVAIHTGHATVWAALSVHLPRVPMYLTRRARRFVAELPQRRVDAFVQSGNAEVCGWARLLGLTPEAKLRAFWPDGSDADVYYRPNIHSKEHARG